MLMSLLVFTMLTQSAFGAVMQQRQIKPWPQGLAHPHFDRAVAIAPATPNGPATPEGCELGTVTDIRDRYASVNPVELYGGTGQGVFETARQSVEIDAGAGSCTWLVGQKIIQALDKIPGIQHETEETIEIAKEKAAEWRDILDDPALMYRTIRESDPAIYNPLPPVDDTLSFRNVPDEPHCFDMCGPLVFGTEKEQAEFMLDEGLRLSQDGKNLLNHNPVWTNAAYAGMCSYMGGHRRAYGMMGCNTGPPQIIWYFMKFWRENTCQADGKPAPMLYILAPDISFSTGNRQPLVTTNEALTAMMMKVMF